MLNSVLFSVKSVLEFRPNFALIFWPELVLPKRWWSEALTRKALPSPDTNSSRFPAATRASSFCNAQSRGEAAIARANSSRIVGKFSLSASHYTCAVRPPNHLNRKYNTTPTAGTPPPTSLTADTTTASSRHRRIANTTQGGCNDQ